VHIISKKKLRDFWALHSDAKAPLLAWFKIVKSVSWEKFADVREVYAKADQVGKYTVFNLGGNKYRLIAHIHFDRGKVYIHEVLTHTDYDRGNWKDG
jgi:mRNA interferase HigB